jgi:FkbM family methyltransferase
MKRLLYRCLSALRRLAWRLAGGRRTSAFGARLNLAPETQFPSYRKLRLPAGPVKSQIVRYGDFVQIHCAVAYLESLGRPASVVEVGAHHGSYAVLLGSVLRRIGGRLLAVEPNPGNFRVLADNVARNGLGEIVVCEQVAVLDRQGSAHLALNGEQSAITQAGKVGTASVQTTTLARLLEKHSVARVDLLIVDVEGAELPVLKGFPWSEVPVGRVFCELHPYAWPSFSYGAQDMQAFLDARGWRCFDMFLCEQRAFPDGGYIGPAVLMAPGGERA